MKIHDVIFHLRLSRIHMLLPEITSLYNVVSCTCSESISVVEETQDLKCM